MTRLSIIAVSLLILFSSCTDYVQVVYAKPITEGVKTEYNHYIYEDNMVKLTYDFWSPRGMMHFTVYNKTNKPLYVDWNKSSFVNQMDKIKYYEGREYTTGVTSSSDAKLSRRGTVYGVPAVGTVGKGVSITNGTTVKEERITFIPPQSSITKTFNNLVGNIYYEVNETQSVEKEIHGINVYEIKPGSDIIFRNFITYSTSEQFDKEYYVDNGFQIEKIESMKSKYLDDFMKPTRFYISDLKEEELFKKKYNER